MSSVLLRLRSAARSGPARPRAQGLPSALVHLPAGVAAAALDPDHWHAGDPRWAPQLALTGVAPARGAAARPGVPSPRHTPEDTVQDTVIHMPADAAPQLVGVDGGGSAVAPPPESSRTPARPDPSTWFS